MGGRKSGFPVLRFSQLSEGTTMTLKLYQFTPCGAWANLLSVPIDAELKRYAQGFDNLREYCDRMKSQVYS